ncbi:MAG: hypothetical protein QOC82_411 [Frankiaceae bacterium]|jgi:hypothetical protein|nr:hypothetical protein [Frankiaceae bacterium]
MGVAHARRPVGAATDETVQDLRAAIRDLPVGCQDEVLEQLFRAGLDYEQTGKVDPLLHFVTSLVMTARLHRNPRYQKALTETDTEDLSGEPVDIASWLADRGVTRSNR